MIKRLIKLSNAYGAAGDEKEIRDFIIKEIKNNVDSLKIDHLGSLIAFKKGTNDKIRVLLSAHMDEVALIVDKIDDNGLLGVSSVGGFLPKVIPAKKVLVGKDRLPGAVVLKSLHLMRPEEREMPVSIRGLNIDIGAKDKSSCNVSIGDYVYFATKARQQGNYLFGKAFDDRVGCAILCEILKEKKLPVSVYAHFCAQEEVGTRGGQTAVFNKERLKFNLNLEGTTANDRDFINDLSPTTEIGKGPAITIMDSNIITNTKILDWVQAIAKEKKIPYQFKRSVVGGTDAGPIYTSKEGLPALNIALPCRYIHSPVAIISIPDLNAMRDLALAVVVKAESFKIK
ncbi:MAG: M28 family peptidase [Candidatus Coatesbacteria bacterium]|nr:M28 family peptidase [Candidatus Coatesbacteria bacterium]